MNEQKKKDVILIGAGVMSTTLGTFLQKLEPNWNIKLFEKLDGAGKESTNEWNNAGTGHAALCELNYTVEKEDGSIDSSKAVEINEKFEISKQFWSYLVKEKKIQNPQAFIRALPHISFVQGEDNVDFLRRRFEALSYLPMFKEMEFTESPGELEKWVPLVTAGRTSETPIAGTKVDSGTDVNFGELTRKLANNLEKEDNIEIHYNSTVTKFHRQNDGKWEVIVRNFKNNTLESHIADFVFLGAGGNAIPLLQKTKIPESKQIGGFPISGAFLVCSNPEIVEQHEAKVYGKEPPGTPPMTVPHLDRRYHGDKDSLLFGPFAAIGPKFLKNGSNLDLLNSIKPNNVLTMLAAGIKNIPLVKYSIQQMLMKKEDRMQALRKYVPDAKDEDWDLVVAGKRVQIIKDTNHSGRGYIQFGTEIVQSEDHSIVALLGESPGASTSVAIMLDVLRENFPEHIETWKPKIKEMIPSFEESLAENIQLLEKVQKSSSHYLALEHNNVKS
ncbi:malate dehydrogenase (quinone) [Virgibacillus natechei]|uniref:Probable malate:quinone oxidoreductase n=1 Tax=Virgibacillus natechei TaxID=1216297 RepID=A0ABS4IIP4_9BACI|nr:malate dehydrogenase (quinone) [Virgibacillus natechei]MBP1970802.1 malate dehydrogenase (quinone) [Virgibacillus natechei]UZD12300.1 malate dehydrogenase (quinone) [Virgibacillus natechei]